MSEAADSGESRADETRSLRSVLEAELRRHYRPTASIAGLERRPSPYSSSYLLEELDVRLADGTRLELLFKHLSRQALLDGARSVKPPFVHHPRREIEVYARLLAPAKLGTPFWYGAHVNAEADTYWLFLEHVKGRKLRHVGEFESWLEVARWLARLHAHFAGAADALERAPIPLLKYTEEFYRLWLGRAGKGWRRARASSTANVERLERIAAVYERVVGRLLKLPRTFIHGDFFASNVLLAETREGVRVCAVDWEMAGLGTGLIDVAALTAGSWGDGERAALSAAYYDALTRLDGAWRPTREEFARALDCCRLHLAVQLLGWAESDWSPPDDEAQDWAGEALRLIRKLSWL